MKRVFLLILLLTPVFVFAERQIDISKVCVSGIIHSDETMAVVNNTMVKQGDSIDGIKVVEIGDSWVKFEYNGGYFLKTLGTDCKKKSKATPQKTAKKTKSKSYLKKNTDSRGLQLYAKAFNSYRTANSESVAGELISAYINYKKALQYGQWSLEYLYNDEKRHAEIAELVKECRGKIRNLAEEKKKINKVQYARLRSPRAISNWLKKNITYKSDSEVYNKEDYWQEPKETIVLKTGDCEDYTFLAQVLLSNMGIKSYAIGIQYSKGSEEGGHAICVFPYGSSYSYFDNHLLRKTNERTIDGVVDDWCRGHRPYAEWSEIHRLNAEKHSIKTLFRR